MSGRYVKKRKYATKRKPYRKSTKRASPNTIQDLLHGAALGFLKRKLGLNTEEKFLDVNGTTTATSTLVARIATPVIPQDATDNGRTGSSIRITRVQTRISISPVLTSTTPSFVRIIQVRNLNSGSVAAASILEVTTEMTSPINKNASALGVQILKDIVVPIGAFNGGNGAYVEWEHSGVGDHLIFTTSDTTGVAANQVKGAITTFWMLDTNFTVAPVFASTSRFFYVDN